MLFPWLSLLRKHIEKRENPCFPKPNFKDSEGKYRCRVCDDSKEYVSKDALCKHHLRKHSAKEMEAKGVSFTNLVYKMGAKDHIEAYERELEGHKLYSVENILLEVARRIELTRFGHLQRELKEAKEIFSG